MILNFIEHVSEFQVFRSLSERNVFNVLVKLFKMSALFTDIPPHYHIAFCLVFIQAFHDEHDVSDVVVELFNHKLVVIL